MGNYQVNISMSQYTVGDSLRKKEDGMCIGTFA